MEVGIDEIAISIPKTYVDVKELAEYRGVDVNKIIDGLGIESISVPYSESLVDLGVDVLKKVNINGVRRFYIATESSNDLSKPVGVKILSKMGLKNVETVELKFACLAGSQALQDACNYAVATGKPSIVLCLDRSIYREGESAEFTQGCAAIAMKVKKNPSIVTLDFSNVGSYIEDVDDFRVPVNSYPYPVVNGKLSIISYLHCMKMAYDNWVSKHPDIKHPLDYFNYFVFHVPFPKMAHHAFAMLYRRVKLGVHLTTRKFMENPELYEVDRAERKKVMELPEFKEIFNKKVLPSLHLSKLIGNCYTGSIFLALISLLENGVENEARIAFGAYGSGAGALAFNGVAKVENISTDVYSQLETRRKLTVEEYLNWRKKEPHQL